ncbi:phosphate ABC transporter substrate-binding protein [Frateuria sp. GZRR35]|uniref:phosphate ABC transporter substrate-binding protein n=1 Tax=unclassified Frateuria TaxID=2648894 RepID=UPI003EDBC7F3
MRSKIQTTLLAATLALATTPAFAGLAVIVSAKSPAAALDKAAAASLYLGKTTALPGGGSAKLYDLPDSNPARERFYQAVAGKSASQVKAVWSRLVFSGRALPPRELANDAAVVKAVAADPAAVGYVDDSALDGSVKAVVKLP